ncbi:hypothetical protein TNCV_2779581 [Trichonephila clavipes]|nr:hypothetical protein TNCV_2779581 [Trichonephila clavipes]
MLEVKQYVHRVQSIILGYVAWRWLSTAIEKFAGAPSCMNHVFRYTIISTPCSIPGARVVRKMRFSFHLHYLHLHNPN